LSGRSSCFSSAFPSVSYDISRGETIYGLPAVDKYLEQSYELFKEIAGKYPNGLIKTKYLGEKSPRYFFYGWLVDRGSDNLDNSHRLPNTVKEFVGVDWETLWNICDKIHANEPDPTKYIAKYNGIDQYLASAWPGWDKVRFIVGYIRYGETDTYGHDKVITEVEGELYVIPGVLRMAGIPVTFNDIKPVPLGAAPTEWAVGLPGDVASGLVDRYSDVVLGPGYTFGLYNVSGGLAKDGIEKIWSSLGPVNAYPERFYLWRK